MAGGDEAVAAVVARAAEDEDAALGELAEEEPGLLGDGEAGVLHERGYGDAGLAFGGLHFGDGDEVHGQPQIIADW